MASSELPTTRAPASIKMHPCCFARHERRRETMSIALKVLGVLLVITGVVWILQGINILPGSFMTGQRQWAVYGAITLIVGVVLFVASRRMGAA
jgi:uncharacterized membrane protein HdeD (DUF308 family)